MYAPMYAHMRDARIVLIAFEVYSLQVVTFLGVKCFPTVFDDLIVPCCVLCEFAQNPRVTPLKTRQRLDRKHLSFLLTPGALVLCLGNSLQRSAFWKERGSHDILRELK